MNLAFFLDIDETLLYHGQGPSQLLLDVVAEAQACGHRFFVNTARAFSNIDPSFFPIDKFDGLCSGCGTYISYKGEVIHNHTLPRELILHAVDVMLTSQPELKLTLEGEEAIYYNGLDRKWKSKRNLFYTSADNLRENYPNMLIQKFASYDYTLVTSETAKKLSNEFDFCFHPHYTEIVPKGYSKGTAVKRVEELLNIPHESTVAIGDSHNDIPMLEYCTRSVAMGNAEEGVKEKCTLVTENVENDGAAKAIGRLCGIDISRFATV